VRGTVSDWQGDTVYCAEFPQVIPYRQFGKSGLCSNTVSTSQGRTEFAFLKLPPDSRNVVRPLGGALWMVPLKRAVP